MIDGYSSFPPKPPPVTAWVMWMNPASSSKALVKALWT